ncbi:hypothetical protein TNCV_3140921 [Trichonephila clavipes]|nr:hypothetical protein TNCV_3140921 [Trichonephila clavipes]
MSMRMDNFGITVGTNDCTTLGGASLSIGPLGGQKGSDKLHLTGSKSTFLDSSMIPVIFDDMGGAITYSWLSPNMLRVLDPIVQMMRSRNHIKRRL